MDQTTLEILSFEPLQGSGGPQGKPQGKRRFAPQLVLSLPKDDRSWQRSLPGRESRVPLKPGSNPRIDHGVQNVRK